MRKPLALLFSLLWVSFNLVAQINDDRVKLPDFAYPQDVIKTATELIKSRSADERVLGALELWNAELLVDNGSLAKSIKRLDSLANSDSDPAVKALLKLMGAEIGRNIRWNRSIVNNYMDNQGTFDEQRIALDSIVTSMLKEAMAIAPPTPLTEFRNAMDWNKIGLSILPTVRDFVAWYSVQADEKFIDDALKTVDTNSPVYFALKYKQLPSKEREAFVSNCLGNPAASYALYYYILGLPSREYIESSSILPEIEFLNKAKVIVAGRWVEETVDNRLKLLHAPYFSMKYRQGISMVNPLPVKIEGYNIDTLTVNCYSFIKQENALSATSNAEELNDGKKVYTKSFYLKNEITGTTVTDSIHLDAGYYVLNVSGGGKTFSTVVTVWPWQFVKLGKDDKQWIQVLDIKTGSPVKDIEAFIIEDEKATSLGIKTDSKGCIFLPDKKDTYLVGFRDPKSGCIFRSFNHDYVWEKSANSSNNNIYLSVTTDLPIYRPGDKVKMLLTAQDVSIVIEGYSNQLYIKLPSPKNDNSEKSDLEPVKLSFGPTDRYGRSTVEFTIPENSPLGNASVSSPANNLMINSGRLIQIAEFKLNDLKIDNVTIEQTSDSIIVRGETVNEAGIGLGNIEIKVKVDYDISPWSIEDEKFSTTIRSTSNGRFEVALPRYYLGNLKSWVSEDDEEENVDEDDTEFYVHIDLEAMSPNGRTASLSKSINMQFPNRLGLYINNCLVDRSDNLNFTVKVEGYRPPEDIKWEFVKEDDDSQDEQVLLSGSGKIGMVSIPAKMLKKLPLGEYELRVNLSDNSAETIDENFTLYDSKESFVPTNEPFIIFKHSLTGPENKIKVGIKEDNTYLWITYNKAPGEISLNDLTSFHLKKGWHEIPVKVTGYNEKVTINISLYAVDKDGTITRENVDLNINKESELSLSCETFRDKLTPGTVEKWQFVTTRNGQPTPAAVFANLMNRKFLSFIRYSSMLPSLRYQGPDYVSNIYQRYKNLNLYLQQYESSRQDYWNRYVPSILLPTWRDLFSDPTKTIDYEDDKVMASYMDAMEGYEVVGYGVMKKANNTGSVATALERAVPGMATNYSETAVATDGAVGSKLYGARAPIAVTSVEVREPKVYTALWEPMLTTGNDGRVDVSFTVPGETTGWELFAEAWTTDLLSARLSHSFTAVKPLVVAPNPPRFVRVGDSVNLVSAITNATDSVMDVSVRVTVEGDSISLADAQSDFTLAAGETRFVNTPVSVDVTGGQLVYTVRASNGVTGDGERNAIPVLASTALVTESRNFYLNPGQAEFSMSLPSPEGTDFSSELHFTANPIWSVVEALPKAIEPWCKAASALAMSIYTSNTALDLNRRFPQAKDVIDIANARKVAQQSLAGLRELQTNDGGFKWGVWADGPDRHSTLAVLDWLASEKERPEMAALINPALEYVDKTAVGKDGKVDTDFLYTVVRSFYGMPADQNGSRVVNATVTDMLRNWKKYSIDQKALTVIALKNYGYDKVAKTILGSLSQFGRMTDDRGFEFPNMPTILAYTHTLEAFASADPNSDIARRIVQHLLYIRQGMDWGSSAFTSYAVRSIMTAASSWVTKASPVAVSVDGVMLPTDADGLAGVINTPVSGRRVTVSRTEPSTPAYGAVVSRFVAPLSDIAPFSDGEVTVTKTIVRVRPDGSQEVLGQNVSVTPGERLTVILKVTAKRPLSNLVVTDNRPAAFEPVVQVPRMVWNRTGSPFYLENRDAMTNIYISYMPAGAAEYSYEVTVNNTGAFTTGLATVTSAIAPEITAHSGSTPFSLSNAK